MQLLSCSSAVTLPDLGSQRSRYMSTHLGQQTGPNIPERIVSYPGVSEGVKEAPCPLSKPQPSCQPCPASSGFQGTDRARLRSRLARIGSSLAPVVPHLPFDFIIFQFSKIDVLRSNSNTAPLSFIDPERFCVELYLIEIN